MLFKTLKSRWTPAPCPLPEHSARVVFHSLLNWGEENQHGQCSLQLWAPTMARLETHAGGPNSENDGKARNTRLTQCHPPSALLEGREGSRSSKSGEQIRTDGNQHERALAWQKPREDRQGELQEWETGGRGCRGEPRRRQKQREKLVFLSCPLTQNPALIHESGKGGGPIWRHAMKSGCCENFPERTNVSPRVEAAGGWAQVLWARPGSFPPAGPSAHGVPSTDEATTAPDPAADRLPASSWDGDKAPPHRLDSTLETGN